ncbi:Thioredoxin, mitochondrial [Armadillidium nasatum]|uniref:Thioredoxin, mitochondrial n=1 Tax=Armadillidium nasatum TaxID=96803 RepID=A0A5N5SJT6_9CRUS|nr:Thioredoxin, mitochondrial [Armadillidium nasatum]
MLRNFVKLNSYQVLVKKSFKGLTFLPNHLRSLNYGFNDNLSRNLNARGLYTSFRDCGMFNVQDEDDFKERVLQSETPVIVDFHAQWCGPCKVLGPRLETIIGGKGDKVHLAKIDIDAIEDLALEYGVSAVPSVLAIKDGKVVDKFVGLQEEARITTFVNKLIGE